MNRTAGSCYILNNKLDYVPDKNKPNFHVYLISLIVKYNKHPIIVKCDVLITCQNKLMSVSHLVH